MLVHRCSNPGRQLPPVSPTPISHSVCFRRVPGQRAAPAASPPTPRAAPSAPACRRPRTSSTTCWAVANYYDPATAPELFGTAPFAAPGDPQNSAVLFRTRNLSILQAITCVRRCCTSLGCARALKLFYSNLTSLHQLQIENRIWRVTSDASCVLQKGRNPRAASPAIVCSDTIIT